MKKQRTETRERANGMKKDIKNNTKKTIINVIFSIMAVVLFCAGVLMLLDAEDNLPPDPSGEGKGYGLWFIAIILFYFPYAAICYVFFWISVYHLLTARPRVLYTIIDVLSIIAFVVPAGIFALNYLTQSTLINIKITNYHLYNFAMSIPFLLFLLRLVCWIIYQIADMGPKRPEPTIIPLDDGRSD